MQTVEIASVAARIYAYILDSAIVVFPCYLGFPILAKQLGLGESSPYLYLSVALLVLVVYEPLMVSMFGRTLGHKIKKIKVVHKEGKNITFVRALFRYVVKVILGPLSFFGLMFSAQTLHDRFSSTYVIDD